MVGQGRLAGNPPCPKCGKVLDAATAVGHDDPLPDPGDLSVCGYCLQPLTWSGERWEKLEKDALVLARLDPYFLMAERAARMFRDSHAKKE